MFCENCGFLLSEGAAYCEHCGSKVNIKPVKQEEKPDFDTMIRPTMDEVIPRHKDDTVIPPPLSLDDTLGGDRPGVNPYAPQEPVNRPPFSVSILGAIKEYVGRYAEFNGRTVRSAYWWAALVVAVVSTILGRFEFLRWVDSVFALATIIPSLAMGVRRMHDIGRSGKTMLWLLLPVIGWIYLIVLCTKISAGDNQWGPAPEECKNNPAKM